MGRDVSLLSGRRYLNILYLLAARGHIVSRRKSSEFQRKLAVFEQNLKTEDPDAITFSNFNWKHSNYGSVSESKTLGTHTMRGGSVLAERTTNGKRGREYEMDISCRTKKLWQN